MLNLANKFFFPILLGAFFGFVVQRGFFCLNSGSTEFLTRKDFSKINAFLLAISIQVILFALLFVFVPAWIPKTEFHPVPAILGGIIFGFSMFYAGGCASGVWFKIGEGKLGALVSVAGLIAGLLLTPRLLTNHALNFMNAGSIKEGSLYLLTTLTAIFAVVLGTGLLLYLARTPDSCPKTSNVGWKTTGSLLALIGILSWISSHFAGRPYGMGIIGGSTDLYKSLMTFSFPKIPWEMLFVIGIPLGSFISAKKDRKFKLQTAPIKKIHRPILGGLGMGIGASLAGGCTVGHGLVGIPVLSLSGIACFGAIVLGVWLRINFQNMLPKKA
jgi:uncharacterized membrane protein YedE/YeeE